MVFSPTMVSYYSLGGFSRPSLGYDTGWVNSLTYETPNLGGFTASLQYAPKETTASGDDVKNSFAISGAYNAGPLSVMAVYTDSGDTSGAYFDRQKNWGLGASYDFGVLKLQGQFSQVKSYENGSDDGKASSSSLVPPCL